MKKARHTHLERGDVLRIKTRNGWGYVQYTGEDNSKQCPTIRVVPGVYSQEPEQLAELLETATYYTTCPIHFALKDGTAEVVRRLPVGERFPSRYRRASLRPNSWIIVENGKRRVVSGLTADELKLSIDSIWPVERLIWALEFGWRPEMDQVPGQVHPGEVFDVWTTPAPGQTGRTVHYLYVGAESDARRVAEYLSKAGFDFELSEAPEAGQWVVRVPRSESVGTPAFDEIETRLQGIADRLGAEYDGWKTVAN